MPLQQPKGMETVNINISGKTIQAKAGETILHALWNADLAKEVKAGCAGGVCGACTVTVRFPDGRPGGSDLACMRLVEEGMEVFPCPVDGIAPQAPVSDPDLEKMLSAFPTLNRCTKCDSCTIACPMSIPVMDSVLRMQKGEFDQVADDFTTCIHCGLCRFVCEDKVQPHNMGIWVRRSLGMSGEFPIESQPDEISVAESEWEKLLSGSDEEIFRRCKALRQSGKIEA